MAITELVIPSLKQDASTRSLYQESTQSLLEMIASSPGSRAQFIAPILNENGVDVQYAVKYAVGLEWEIAQNFYDFVAGSEFKSHVGHVMSLFTGPPQTQLFYTDLSPVAVFSSNLTEVFRFKIGAGGSALAAVRDSWISFVAEIERTSPGLPSLSGNSLNLDEQLFLGVIGWEGTKARESIMSKEVVKSLRSKLESLGAVDSFSISFVALKDL